MSLRNTLLLLATQNTAKRTNTTPDTREPAPPPQEVLAQLENHLEASQQLLNDLKQWFSTQQNR
ncbi:hypothetical protein [Zoogloea sp.]|uniref:hypothetical protein n=1 Tax=Zoogloea sp. TaxID=49181 RepID=UPI0035AE807B